MKYENYLNNWMENYVKIATKQRTTTRYAEIISKHIDPRLGDYEIDNLTTLELQKFVAELLTNGNKKNGKGLSTNAVNAIITLLQSSLGTAKNLGLISSNPASKIKRPKINEKKVESFTLEEQKKIVQAITADKKRPLLSGVVLCLYTGLRIGELLALEWSDIDLNNNMLSVTKTCFDGKNKDGIFGRILNCPKTKSSYRTIPIPKQIIPLIKELKKKSTSKYVIEKNGEPILIRTYQRAFKGLLKRLNIPYKCFHTIRHTFATRAIECGMDVKTLSEVLGHKNATITLNRYVHSRLEHKKDMMNRLGKLF